jgi:hypothetical protein
VNEALLSQIEETFSRLSTPEQLSVIERLVRHVHDSTLKRTANLDDALALMAADPEVRSELQQIDREFSYADGDGLESA